MGACGEIAEEFLECLYASAEGSAATAQICHGIVVGCRFGHLAVKIHITGLVKGKYGSRIVAPLHQGLTNEQIGALCHGVIGARSHGLEIFHGRLTVATVVFRSAEDVER